jgi:hypothetical protein
MVVSKNRKGRIAILFSGNTLPWYLKYMFPVTVYTEADTVPFLFSKRDSEKGLEHLSETADAFLPGFSPDDCITVENTTDSGVITTSTTVSSVERYLSSLPDSITVKSLKPPLYDLSQLYAQSFDISFILWKFTERGSVAGYVENGMLIRNITSWIGIEDIKENSTVTAAEIDNWLKELSGSDRPVPLVYYPELPAAATDALQLKYGTITRIPAIEPLPSSDHELFAIASSDNNQMNAVPYDILNSTEKLTRFWQWTIHGMRILLIIVISILFVIFSSVVFQKLSQHFMNDSLHELNTLRTAYTIEKNRFDSLKTLFLKNAGHIQKESAVTNLLDNLQHIFPNGMGEEEMTSSESGESFWKLTIRALSSSSELLPLFNSNFKKLTGTVNHRVIYSESTVLKNSKSVMIRVKVECEWKAH